MREIKTFNDFKLIIYYTGYVILGTTMLMILPILTSLAYREWNAVLDFTISLNISVIIALAFIILGKSSLNRVKMEWKHGLIITSLAWILLTILCSIPYKLSGHMGSFLDGIFDVMSGFTTTGLALIQDVDHVSMGLNMWRHMLTFLGGQGMVVLALMFLINNTAGAYKMYVGEGKDVELVPNVKGTSKIIWIISFVYLGVGTFALWIDGMFIVGLKPISSFFHGLFIFMSAWSTGGFTPMSQNMLYYHSFSYEVITIIIFILGSLNFGLHYAIWRGNNKELIKNIEVQSFVITATLCSFFAAMGLAKVKAYPDAVALFRKGVYSVLSAHTGTGLFNIYARQFFLEWGDFALAIIIIAMLLGGSACSTAGGFKCLRVGLVFKGMIMDIKKLLSSERRIKVYKYHHLRDIILEDTAVKGAALIILCYIVLFAVGTLMGTYYGYPLISSAFEMASITGNVGLTIGVLSPDMPTTMKVYYVIAMYLGRLEFISIFALVGFIGGGVNKVCKVFVK